VLNAAAFAIVSLRLGFTGTLKVIRTAIPQFQDAQAEQLPFGQV